MELNLADTQVAEVSVLAVLKSLKQLDLSGTPVTRFDGITSLALDTLKLVRSKLNELPPALPREGDWALELDDTAIGKPVNFAPDRPFKSSWISHDSNVPARGEVSEHRIEAEGEIGAINDVRLYPLPKTTFSKASTIKLTAHLGSGRVRLWLEEPPELFSSPWFTEGKVKGFGRFRRSGYVWADLAAGGEISFKGVMSASYTDRNYERHSASRRGNESPWVHYGFFVEPIGTGAQNLSWQITNKF